VTEADPKIATQMVALLEKRTGVLSAASSKDSKFILCVYTGSWKGITSLNTTVKSRGVIVSPVRFSGSARAAKRGSDLKPIKDLIPRVKGVMKVETTTGGRIVFWADAQRLDLKGLNTLGYEVRFTSPVVSEITETPEDAVKYPGGLPAALAATPGVIAVRDSGEKGKYVVIALSSSVISKIRNREAAQQEDDKDEGASQTPEDGGSTESTAAPAPKAEDHTACVRNMRLGNNFALNGMAAKAKSYYEKVVANCPDGSCAGKAKTKIAESQKGD
jgi:hypothetical protein